MCFHCVDLSAGNSNPEAIFDQTELDIIIKGQNKATATRRVGKNLLVVSGKTVSDFLKIHTFLMLIFKTIFNENYKKLQALKLAFKSFSSKMSKLAIF